MTQEAKAAIPTVRILLADDDADTRDYLKHLLSQRYEVEVVAHGIAAVHPPKQLPDLVLADVMMTGLDGFEVVRSLRTDSQTRELPIILLSAQAEEEACIAGLEAGADDYVTKPFSDRELLARIEAHLRIARLRQEAACREQELRAQSVAAQRKAEAARDQISNILESITDAFVAFDCQWRYTYVNEQATRLLQKTREELLGKQVWEEVFPETVGTLAYQEFHRAISEQVAVVFEEFGQSIGKWLEIHACPSSDGLAVYFRDISDAYRQATLHKRIEAEKQQLLEQVQTERGFLEAVLRHMPAGVIIAEAPSGRLILGNKQVEQIWRHPFLSASDIEQYREYQGFHPDERPYQPEEWPLARSITTGEVVMDEEIGFLRGDGTRGTIRVSSAPIRDAQGSITAGVVTFYDITDRKQAEEALRQREAELTLITNTVPVLISFVDAQQCYRFNNQRYEEWLGYPATQVYGKHLREVLGESAYEVVRPYVEQVLAGQQVTYESQLSFGDSETRYISATYVPRFDSQGNVEGFVALVSDISDAYQQATLRKQMEIQLQRSNERFELAMAAVNCLIYDWNIEQDTVERSEGLTRILGYSLVEVEPTSEWWRKRVHPEDLQRLQDQAAVILATSDRFTAEYRVRNKDDQYIHVLDQGIVAARNADGHPVRIVGSTTDISERKQAEAALQQYSTRLTLALDAARMGSWDWDIQTNQVLWTRYHEVIFGYKPGTPKRTYQDWADRVHPDDLRRVEATVQAAMVKKQDYDDEYRVIWSDGSLHWVSSFGRFQYDAEGQPIRMLGMLFDITARKQAEEGLRQSEERFQAFMNNSPAAAWITDADGYVLYLSQTYFRLFKFATNDAIGKSIFELYPAEIAQQFLDNIKTVAQTNQALETIEPAPRTDDTIGDFLVYKFPIADASGQHLVGGVAIDITERKRAEEALRASEERFRVIVDQATAGIAQVDLTGRFVLVNQRYCDIVGYPMAELLQKRMQDITHPDDLSRNVELFQRLVTEAGNDFLIEKRYIRKDGSEVWVSKSVSAACDTSGKPQYVIAVLLDVTDRKRAEAERAQLLAREQQQTRRLQKLTEASLTINSTLSLNERLQLITDQARDIIEAHQSVTSLTVGENWAQAIHAVSLSQKYAQWRGYEEKSDGSGIYTRVCQMQRPMRMTQAELEAHPAWRGFGKEAGKHPPLRGWLAAPLTSSNGKNIGLIQLSDKYEGEFTQEDESILVQLAQMASAAIDNARLYEESQQANRLKDEFLAVLSHELRSPLNPILGWSKLLRTRKLDEKTTDRALETIERSAQVQTQLIEDLLDVSRILQGKLSLNVCPVDLTSTIRAAMETVHLAAQAKSIQIQTRLEPDVGQVSGDPSRLQQVVWNLLSNAVKFTPARGRVEVRLSVVSRQSSVVSGQSQQTTNNGQLTTDKYAQIQVSDTGKGISPDFLPHVFDYFRQADSTTTRKFGGLGLGLAIARNLVELHGGTVHAESPGVGQGATFTVRLPLMPTSPKMNQDSRQSEQSLDLNGIKLLVVDDDASAREYFTFLLELHGANVTAVASAGEAFAALTESKPDVLLSDIGMPEVDGYMLIQQVRTLPPEQGGQIRAIALTAYAGEINYQQALSAGFQRHISKPVEPAKLIEVIANLVRQSE